MTSQGQLKPYTNVAAMAKQKKKKKNLWNIKKQQSQPTLAIARITINNKHAGPHQQKVLEVFPKLKEKKYIYIQIRDSTMYKNQLDFNCFFQIRYLVMETVDGIYIISN